MDYSKTKLADDPELRVLLDIFVGELKERIGAMRRAVVSEDGEQLRMLAHRLKGTAGSYGLMEISEAAAQIETELQGGTSFVKILPLLDSMEGSL